MTWDAVHHSRETFLAYLRAQCAPGTAVGPVPAPALTVDRQLDTALAVLLSLLDPGLTLAASGDDATSVADRVLELTGATRGTIEDADFVLVTEAHAGVFAAARRGTRAQPERGATVVVAGGHPGTTVVSLTGPGIETIRNSSIALPADALSALSTANAELPRGIDLVLVGDGELVALPRTSVVDTEVA